MTRRLLLVLVALAACTSTKASSGTTTASKYTPVFAKIACTNPTDARVECGTLTVPEDRSKPDGRKVVMPVAIVHTADPNPAPDPVLYLSGGPGDAALTETDRFLTKGQTGNRDVILLDQRGTGGSQPLLDCPEVTAGIRKVLGAAESYEVEAKIARDALLACRDRLRSSGVDLGQYNTAAVADDISDLRIAMGISEWNLFGVSYGTMDALVTMRTHPEGIRSVVLDSVVPADVGTGAPEIAASSERGRRNIFDGCARDTACHTKYPDLEADLNGVVNALDATPYQSSIEDPISHEQIPILLNGADAIAGLFVALYDTQTIPTIPSVVELMKAGAIGPVVDQLAIQGIEFVNRFAAAQAASVNCFDRAALLHEGDDARLAGEKPEISTLLLFTTVSCKDFGVPAAPEGFNDPVHSDIPTLVLAGEYDEVTLPEQSKHAAETLTHSTFVQFPAMGHAEVFAAPECPETVFRGFLAAPTAPVDTSCVAAMAPPAWI